MSSDDERSSVRDLLAAYAMDAVDDVERRAVERLVASDPSAAQELASLREVTAMLGAAVSSPPPDAVRAAVLAGVATTPQVAGRATPSTPPASARARDRSATGSRRASSRLTRLTRLTVGIAAAVAVAVAVPSVVAWREHDRAVQAEARAQLIGAVLAEPGAQVLRGDVVGGGEAVAVLGAERAVLLADGLASVPEGRTYQLWAMRDGVPVPAGLLEVTDGRLEALAAEYRSGDGLALSVEPAGGSKQPSTDPVVVLLPS
ncbi:MAG TPA: anti-sigma factor [Propionicimonas sp.]